MDESMRRNYGNISLAEDEEEEGLLFDNVGIDTPEFDFRWCLVGRFLTDRSLDFMAMQHKNGFVVETWKRHDCEGVQLHGLKTGFMSEIVVKQLGNYIGTFVESDMNNFMGLWRDYLRVRVTIQVDQPLKRKKKLQVKNEPDCYAHFKYEDLSAFCFICCILGHSEKFCDVIFTTPPHLITKNYSFEMKAEPRRRRQHSIGAKWLREGRAVGSSSSGSQCERDKSVVNNYNGEQLMDDLMSYVNQLRDNGIRSPLIIDGSKANMHNVANGGEVRVDRYGAIGPLIYMGEGTRYTDMGGDKVGQSFSFSKLFENAWLKDPLCYEIVKSCWNDDNNNDIFAKINSCAIALAAWGKEITGNFNKRIKKCRAELKLLKNKRDELSVSKYSDVKKNLFTILDQKEAFWKQRSMQFWLKGGDQNSKYFHRAASNRRIHNRITKLRNNNGDWVEWGHGLEEVIVQYYNSLFLDSGADFDEVIECIQTRVSDHMNEELNQQVSEEEGCRVRWGGTSQQFWDISRIRKGVRWRVGDGLSISVLGEPWLPDEENPMVMSSHPGLEGAIVNNLFREEGGGWDMEILEDMFDERDRNLITKCLYKAIWNVRNETVWKKKKVSALDIVASAKNYLNQWRDAQNFQIETPCPDLQKGHGAEHWTCPPVNSVKINIERYLKLRLGREWELLP
uniref:Zinc knuckle CX2CX4HX4C domain-containing protein n=1 Tax=Cannabis sativa TaxID=3483 RepID=A0A803P4M6_CANSA